MMKHLKTAVFGLAMGLSAMGAAQAETVKIGYSADPYPPFVWMDASGKWHGWEVEFKDAICKEAKLDCQIELLTWDGLVPGLVSKKIDLIIGSLSITDERKKIIDFSDKYYSTPAVLMIRKGEAVEATPESLDGKVIGVLVSTIHQQYAVAHYPSAEVKEYQNQDEMYQDLAAGRVDAVLADAIAIGDFLKTENGSCCESKGAVPDDPAILGAGVGIALRQGEDDLKARLNAAIKTIRENGTYDEISKKYFDFDIYGAK